MDKGNVSEPGIEARFHYDTSARIEHAGVASMHCAICLDEFNRRRDGHGRVIPYDETPRSWARQQLFITEDGSLQLWCTRHDMNIAVITTTAARPRPTISSGGK